MDPLSWSVPSFFILHFRPMMTDMAHMYNQHLHTTGWYHARTDRSPLLSLSKSFSQVLFDRLANCDGESLGILMATHSDLDKFHIES